MLQYFIKQWHLSFYEKLLVAEILIFTPAVFPSLPSLEPSVSPLFMCQNLDVSLVTRNLLWRTHWLGTFPIYKMEKEKFQPPKNRPSKSQNKINAHREGKGWGAGLLVQPTSEIIHDQTHPRCSHHCHSLWTLQAHQTLSTSSLNHGLYFLMTLQVFLCSKEVQPAS